MKALMQPFTIVINFAMTYKLNIGGHSFTFFQLWTFALIVGAVAWLFNRLID